MSRPDSLECMSVRGIVRGVGDGDRVEIDLIDSPRCRGCEGTCMWRRAREPGRLQISCKTSVAVGDHVSVSMPGIWILAGSLMLYGVPLAGVLIGALCGLVAGGSDLSVLFGVLVGGSASVIAVPGLKRRVEQGALTGLRLERL